MTWTIVIPIKGGPEAKSRLGMRPDLSEAIALDTLAAAIGTGERVIVVSSAPWAFGSAEVVADPGAGLAAAIAAGVAHANGPVAVLLGDIPGLQRDELAEALESASAHPLAFVADADGTGTVLATALDPRQHRLAFGQDSAHAHRQAGYTELIGDWPGLRRDVDLLEHLDEVPLLGPLTRASLRRA